MGFDFCERSVLNSGLGGQRLRAPFARTGLGSGVARMELAGIDADVNEWKLCRC